MASSRNTGQRRNVSTGTLGKRAVKKIMEELTCTICLEIFTDPRILPCRHSFCLECLQGMAQGSTGTQIKCPNCNATSTLSGPVSDLPSDFKTNSLLAHMKKPDEQQSQQQQQQQQQQQSQQQHQQQQLQQQQQQQPQQPRSPTVPTQPTFRVSSGTEQADITCPICETIFQDQPRQLTCGHTFCTRCLEFMKPVQLPLIISCPCCDSQTNVTHGVKNLQVHVDKHTKVLLHRMPPDSRQFDLIYNLPDLESSDEDDVDHQVSPTDQSPGGAEEQSQSCCTFL